MRAWGPTEWTASLIRVNSLIRATWGALTTPNAQAAHLCQPLREWAWVQVLKQLVQVTWLESSGFRGKQRQSLHLGTSQERALSVCLLAHHEPVRSLQGDSQGESAGGHLLGRRAGCIHASLHLPLTGRSRTGRRAATCPGTGPEPRLRENKGFAQSPTAAKKLVLDACTRYGCHNPHPLSSLDSRSLLISHGS